MNRTTSMRGRARPENPPLGAGGEWPLTGRVAELNQICGLIRRRDGLSGQTDCAPFL